MYADAPRVRITVDDKQPPYIINVNETVWLRCIAEGFPIPTIRWYENNALIPRQSFRSYNAPTHTPGKTVYTCEAKNYAGNMKNIAKANTTLQVKSTYVMCICYVHTYMSLLTIFLVDIRLYIRM